MKKLLKSIAYAAILIPALAAIVPQQAAAAAARASVKEKGSLRRSVRTPRR